MVNSKSQVFLFLGPDTYSKEKAIKELSSSVLGGSSRELDYKVFDANDSDAGEIIGYLTTIPFLAGRRLAVIKDFQNLPTEAGSRIINYVKNPLQTTLLVLETSSVTIPEKYHELSGVASIRRFDNPTDLNFSSWVRQFLASHGDKKIDEDAVKYLRELQGAEMLSLARELEKVISFVGERDRITLDDVEGLVGASLTRSAFDLTDAVQENDVDRALAIVSDLTLAGRKHYEVIGLLSWHVKRLLTAKTLQEKGRPDSHIAERCRIGRRYSDEFFRQVRSLEIFRIKSMMKALLAADLDIKRTRYSPASVLEFAVIRLCFGLGVP